MASEMFDKLYQLLHFLPELNMAITAASYHKLSSVKTDARE